MYNQGRINLLKYNSYLLEVEKEWTEEIRRGPPTLLEGVLDCASALLE